MEEFMVITMTTAEYKLLERAAKKKRTNVQGWALSTLLDAAAKATKEKEPADPAITASTQRLVAEYIAALGYEPAQDQRGRTWSAGKQLADSGADPEILGKVLAWLRTVDGRYKNGQYCPLQMVAQAWPAYIAQLPAKASESPSAAREVPEATVTPLTLFGAGDDDWI